MANKTHPQPTHPAILLSYCILLSGKLKIRRKFYIEQIVFCRGSKAWGIVRAGEGARGGGSASWLTASLSSQFGIQEDDEQQHEHMKIDCVFGFSFSFVFSLSFGFFLLFLFVFYFYFGTIGPNCGRRLWNVHEFLLLGDNRSCNVKRPRHLLHYSPRLAVSVR